MNDEPPKPPKAIIEILLPNNEADALEKLANIQGMTLAQLVRRVIRREIRKQEGQP